MASSAILFGADALLAQALRKYSGLLPDALFPPPCLLLVVPHYLLLPVYGVKTVSFFVTTWGGGVQGTQLNVWTLLPLCTRIVVHRGAINKYEWYQTCGPSVKTHEESFFCSLWCVSPPRSCTYGWQWMAISTYIDGWVAIFCACGTCLYGKSR